MSSLVERLAAVNGRRKERKRNIRKSQRYAQIRHELRMGKQPKFTGMEALGRAGMQLVGDDFFADLDRLLDARQRHLWIVWRGHEGQVYTADYGGGSIEILQHADKRSGTLDVSGMLHTEMGKRISKLLELHGCEMDPLWAEKRFRLRLGHRDVPDIHGFRMIECRDGTKCRYMLAREDKAARKGGAGG